MRFRLTVLVMALVYVIAACSSGDDTSEATSTTSGDATTTTVGGGDASTSTSAPPDDGSPARDTVTINVGTEPPTLDMSISQGTALAKIVLLNVLETLVTVDPESGEVVPQLAESWEVSDDGLTYTFVIRDGATFSTGEPVLASDVVFSIETLAGEASPHATRYAAMESVSAIDDRTVEVVLSTPSNLWFEALTTRAGPIFSEAHYADMATNPIGSGPFAFAEVVAGDHITLERNPHYDQAEPALSSVNFTFISDQNAAINALMAGDVDVIDNLGARDRATELEEAGFVVSPDPAPAIRSMAMNVARIDDVRVRQAIAHGIDREAVREAIGGGYGTIVGSWERPTDAWYQGLDPYPYDPARAQELLAEAGYPDGITIELTTITDNVSTTIGELLALILEPVGVTLEIKPLELAVYREQVTVGNPPKMDYFATVSGAELGIEWFANGVGWFTNWNDVEFNQLIADADVAATQDERNALMEQAVQRFADEVPVIAMYSDVNLTVRDAAIAGWIARRIDNAINVGGVSWSS